MLKRLIQGSCIHGRRPLLSAMAVVCLAASACGGQQTHADGRPTPAPVAVSPTAPSPSAAAAVAELHRVLAATAAVHSYAFSAVETVGGSTTRVTGRAVRPRALTYTLTTGGRTEQAVRVGTTTYRRVPPAPYRRLVRQRAQLDPLNDLLSVLRRLTSPAMSTTGDATVLTGTLDAAGVRAAGLLRGGRPDPGLTVPVRLVADTSGRVTLLTATLPLRRRGKTLSAQVVTRYSGFDRQPAIPVPHG